MEECIHELLSQPRWSSGYHTRLWIRGSRVRSRPGPMDFCQIVKILSMTSLGREVNPWVPCRRLTARKKPQAEIRALEQNLSIFTLTVERDANDLGC